jgi:spermidine synthase
MRSQSRLLRVSPLLFASGFCALIYQTTWLREFRLIFGASTAASAAVLGIFMGGLGLGSAVLGRRSESKARPLEFYAKLESMIAASAAATPILLWMIRHTYLAMGGTLAMGLTLGTIVRLLMSALAIGLPTFLMGGTLPAIARVVTPAQDANRRSVALLYGINTLGAVAGAAASTFYFFEAWGNHLTLGLAASFNLVVALIAFWISKTLPAGESGVSERKTDGDGTPAAPPNFVFAACAVAGFAFLLMELVWYRMLCPLLGGSTFTFGLILAVALLGIGLGGLIYAFGFGERRVTLNGFAFVCALEALFIAVPYALGDRIALATMLLRPLGSLGFYGHVIAWTTLCVIVTLPAAIISGMQFPMLIALLGKGRNRVGSQTGTAYAWNTGGAIIGSLAGGFGLLPALSAPGIWRWVVVLLCLLAGVAAAISIVRRLGSYSLQVPALGAVILALVLLTTTGPTAFWRHSQIGVGRLTKLTGSKSDYHDLENALRRDILWDADGVESSVALSYSHGINFVVNGRCDGHATGDSGTQIMLGLIPAGLYGKPTRALVVGLGTGSTAGWLAAVPSMKRVDVVELEPAIVRIAQACESVNHQALSNPKVHVIIGDGREVLLSTREKYDVIASEPSNPYRAGIASLFTREYYEAAASRLNPGGLFAQWIQAYETNASTIQTVYATLGSVFSHIDTWRTDEGDLLMVASTESQIYDADTLRGRFAEEPFKSALVNTWRVNSLEGVLAHFVVNNSLARALEHVQKAELNTDDRTVLEFAFARNVDLRNAFRVETLRSGARASHADRLALSRGEVDWDDVESERLSMLLTFGETPNPEDYDDPEYRSRAAAYVNYAKGNFATVLKYWREQPREVKDLNDLRMVAECLADEGGTEAFGYIKKLKESMPLEADGILAHLLMRRGEFDRATDVLVDVFHRLRTDPWMSRALTERTLTVAQQVVENTKSDVSAQRLYEAIRFPFSVYNSEEPRRMRFLWMGMRLDNGKPGEYTLAAVELAEPYVPWQPGFLKVRKRCYEALGSPRFATADRELKEFLAEQPSHLDAIAFLNETKPDDKEAPIKVSDAR